MAEAVAVHQLQCRAVVGMQAVEVELVVAQGQEGEVMAALVEVVAEAVTVLRLVEVTAVSVEVVAVVQPQGFRGMVVSVAVVAVDPTASMLAVMVVQV